MVLFDNTWSVWGTWTVSVATAFDGVQLSPKQGTNGISSGNILLSIIFSMEKDKYLDLYEQNQGLNLDFHYNFPHKPRKNRVLCWDLQSYIHHICLKNRFYIFKGSWIIYMFPQMSLLVLHRYNPHIEVLCYGSSLCK